MSRLHKKWRSTPATVRKPLIFLLGFTVVLAGIVMLPVPGPGWPIIFLGFAILATEFAFAERVRDRLIDLVKQAGIWLEHAWRRLLGAFKHKHK